MMMQHNIQHLPIVSGSHFREIVPERELLFARLRLGERFSTTPLEQICGSDMLVIRPADSIEEVARKMLERSTDGAVVVDGGFVVGASTTTDVSRLISDFFGQP